MATTATVRTALKTLLDSIGNFGQVHPYERFATRKSEFENLYKLAVTQRVCGWNITRTLHWRKGTDVFNKWRIRGYMSLDDADQSELLFDALVDAAVLTVANDSTLGGEVDSILIEGKPDGMQLVKTGPVMLGGVLCHSAELTLFTQHEEGADLTALDDFVTFHADYDIDPKEPAGEYQQWLQEPPDYADSLPDAQDEVTLEQ